MSSIVCAHCGTESTARRQGRGWCVPCGIWLIRDEETTEWISVAEHAHCQPRYRQRQAIAQTSDAARAAQPAADALLPAGWRSSLTEASHGGCCTLDLHPPAGPVDVYAYLVPPIGGFGWRVRVHNRTTGVCRALFTPGTATAVTFPDVPAAVEAAIAAVHAATTTVADAVRTGATP
jgi:hypothetical protein